MGTRAEREARWHAGGPVYVRRDRTGEAAVVDAVRWASALANAGTSLYEIGAVLRHRQLSTTTRYARRDGDRRRPGVEPAAGAGGRVATALELTNLPAANVPIPFCLDFR